MTYKAMADMYQSTNLRRRVDACASTVVGSNPYPNWINDAFWGVVSQPGWSEAWLAAATTDPGGDETVITDAMILDAVNAVRTDQLAPSAE